MILPFNTVILPQDFLEIWNYIISSFSFFYPCHEKKQKAKEKGEKNAQINRKETKLSASNPIQALRSAKYLDMASSLVAISVI